MDEDNPKISLSLRVKRNEHDTRGEQKTVLRHHFTERSNDLLNKKEIIRSNSKRGVQIAYKVPQADEQNAPV